MERLVLIRHGQTDANKNMVYCGSTDLPLNAEGEMLLREIREKGELARAVFGGEEEASFFTSGMLRTEQTFKLLFGDVPHRALPDFREIDFGKYELKSYELLKEDPEYRAWLQSAGDVPAPGGESADEMKARVLRGLRRLQEGPDRNVVLVTHGGVIVHIMRHFFPQEDDPNNRYRWQPTGGHGFIISFGETGPGYEGI